MRWDAEVRAAITRWAPAYGVAIDPALVHAIIERESRHGAAGLVALEPDGDHSYGPMMVKASTARSQLGVARPDTLKDPALGISAGTRYLAWQLKRYAGDTTSAVAAYNAGSARRAASGAFINQPYVVAVLGFWNTFKRAAAATAPALVPILLLTLAAFLLLRRRRLARG